MPLRPIWQKSCGFGALIAVCLLALGVSSSTHAEIITDPTQYREEPVPSYTKKSPAKTRTPEEAATGFARDILGSVGRKAETTALAEKELSAIPAPITLDRMIGQLILVGFRGTSSKARDVQRTLKAIREGKVGGVLVMGHNIKTSPQLRLLTRAFEKAAGANPVPFISVDQEGGLVQRLGPKIGLRKYPSADKIAKTSNAKKAIDIYERMAQDLATHGINLNFGPVVDLKVNAKNPVIARPGRSYGKSADVVTRFATAFVDAHRRRGVLTAAKHFPGHGSSQSDSHKGFVDITRTWSETELAPYQKLAKSDKLDMVMIGHLFHNGFIKGGKDPATLSHDIVTGLLRDRIGFNGVVITDDLYMAAVRKRYTLEESFVRAIEAGNDVIMLTGVEGRSADPARLHAILRQAVDSGRLSVERIKQSYNRVINLKRRMFESQRRASRRPGLEH